MPPPLSVHYIFFRMAHHSPHSGYDQLAKHIGGRVVGPNRLHRFLDRWPERVLAQLRRTGGTWYNSHALKLELQLLPDFVFKSGRIYHFLYGEDGFHYAGALNPRKSNKIVATFHMPPEKFQKTIQGTTTRHLKTLDAAIIVAPNQECIFRDVLPPENLHLIPHGVDIDFFRPPDRRRPGKRCLFVGTHLRDFSVLRTAIEAITRRDPGVTFTVVTFKESFEHFQGLQNVHLHTSVPEDQLVGFYRSADLLLLPVTDGTANNTILEAMACGLPVVTTRAGGLHFYLNDQCAVQCEPGDAAGMAARALEIINSPRRQQAMARAAREQAERFSWTIIAEKTRGVYRSLFG